MTENAAKRSAEIIAAAEKATANMSDPVARTKAIDILKSAQKKLAAAAHSPIHSAKRNKPQLDRYLDLDIDR